MLCVNDRSTGVDRAAGQGELASVKHISALQVQVLLEEYVRIVIGTLRDQDAIACSRLVDGIADAGTWMVLLRAVVVRIPAAGSML